MIETCRTAWNTTKQPHQPEYDELIESYRDMLTALAEAVLATGTVEDGPFAGFERAVLTTPVSSDQGFEQVVDAEPFYEEPIHLESQGSAVIEPDEPTEPLKGTITVDHEAKSATVNVESLEDAETARLARAKRRKEAQPPPKSKVVKVVKKAAVKKVAKKVAPKK